jgi:hypothetical protein
MDTVFDFPLETYEIFLCLFHVSPPFKNYPTVICFTAANLVFSEMSHLVKLGIIIIIIIIIIICSLP